MSTSGNIAGLAPGVASSAALNSEVSRAQTAEGTKEPISSLDGDVGSNINNANSATAGALATSNDVRDGRAGSVPSTYRMNAVYDPALNTYNLKPKHLLKTRAKLRRARAGVDFWRLGFIGDSTMAGFGSTSADTDSMPAMLKRMLLNHGLPNDGSGIVPAYANFTMTDQGHDARLSFVGTNWAGWHSGTSPARIYNGSTSETMTFTSKLGDGDIGRVYYPNASTNFTISVDGGAPQSITPSGGAGYTYYQVTGLGSGPHTFVVTPTTGTVILGFEVENSANTGLRVMNAGVSAATPDTFNTTDPNDLLPWLRDQFLADTIVIQLEENPINNGWTVSSFSTKLQSVITAARAGGADVIVLTSYCVQMANYATANTFTAALYDLAVSMDFPVIDLWDRWGSDPTAANLASLRYNTAHPNPSGYADAALALYNVLVGGGVQSAPAGPFRGASVGTSSAQSIPNGTQTALSCPSIAYDTAGFTSSAQPTRLTVPTGLGSGYYRVTAIATATAAVGTSSTRVNLTLSLNGTGLAQYASEVAGGVFVGNDVSAVLKLNEGDYVQALIYQNAGAAASFNGVLSIEKIG